MILQAANRIANIRFNPNSCKMAGTFVTDHFYSIIFINFFHASDAVPPRFLLQKSGAGISRVPFL